MFKVLLYFVKGYSVFFCNILCVADALRRHYRNLKAPFTALNARYKAFYTASALNLAV